MPRRSTQLRGAAGEYYAAAELSRREWAASVTPKNAPGTDIVAHDSQTGKLVAVQVKTATGNSPFRLSRKHEQPTTSAPLWFVLVRIPDDDGAPPDFYVVPAVVVSAYVYVRHWVRSARATERAGSPRGQHDMRQIEPDDIAGYRDRWDLL